MNLPRDVVEYTSTMLNATDMANLSSTCKEYRLLGKYAKRKMRREEVLRCAKILKTIYDSLGTGDYVILNNNDFDPIVMLVLDFLWFNNMPEAYEWVDPELYNAIQFHADIPTLWKFSKKVYEIILSDKSQ